MKSFLKCDFCEERLMHEYYWIYIAHVLCIQKLKFKINLIKLR